ncbi:hypothetical protein Sango_0137200 [Sesamum angolense]|uniref:Uncharacterized protein n=1 Tax=Sesamum angolense TaxID=2727404 RepID=A0AAE2C690_9LAMI|nr:hypothetical protein Sango_0137200 [Sesamum angolense]
MTEMIEYESCSYGEEDLESGLVFGWVQTLLEPTLLLIHPTQTATSDSGGSSNNGASSTPSLSTYSEQYKALDNLDFMTATKILFTESPKKKKFGLDFHLVQLFFACLPSLDIWDLRVDNDIKFALGKIQLHFLSRNELERKKQAEFEAQAKELELKAAEEKAASSSNPELLEVKERLDKLEVTVKEIVVAKKQSSDAVRTGQDDIIEQKQAAQVEPDNSRHEPVGKTSKERGTASNEGETGGLGPVTHASQSNQKDNTKRGTFGEAKKWDLT